MIGDKDNGHPSLLELFRSEAESQVQVLTRGLLALDSDAQNLPAIEPLMRAAHSLKGAARVVSLESIERLAHGMEDCFVAAQKGRLRLNQARIDRLLAAVDLISQIASLDEQSAPAWLNENKLHIANRLADVYDAADPHKLSAAGPETASPPAPEAPPQSGIALQEDAEPARRHDEQVLKVNARNFDRLLSLASESRVTAHALQPGLQSLAQYKRKQHEMFAAFEQLSDALRNGAPEDTTLEKLATVRQRIEPLKRFMVQHIADLEAYERRLLGVSQEMLNEVLTLRMRPFRDGVRGLPRMVRDLARSLGKEVRLDIIGEDTLVDRDILARMESPLNQLLRNAIDHGMEPASQRIGAGKTAQGQLRLEARHSAGMLTIQVSDDGQGVDLEKIRRQVVERKMASEAMAAAMSNAELLDFLFLPAFSLKETAGTISGRGVGLDVVHATVRELNGSVRTNSEQGKGFQVWITLPLSQSIVRALVVTISDEAYAIPIAKIDRIISLPAADIRLLEDRQFFSIGDEHIGVISAAHLLDLGEIHAPRDMIPVIVVGSAQHRYALAVDAIVGEQSLAVQPTEPVFGKIRDVAAAALLDDGSPVLILDVADLLAGIDKLANEGSLRQVHGVAPEVQSRPKRVLVIDDSLTVREMERKLLAARGYDIDVAVDGMDGWNAVRSHPYDLVITDVDMPRMDGIELVSLIKKDGRLHNLPVMIVSYKDRPEDRTRGIEAGADYYLTKGSFHDETLLEAVRDLIGESGT